MPVTVGFGVLYSKSPSKELIFTPFDPYCKICTCQRTSCQIFRSCHEYLLLHWGIFRANSCFLLKKRGEFHQFDFSWAEIDARFVAVIDIQPAPLSSQPSSEEQLLLLGQELTSRPASGGGGSRGRSISFCLPFSAASPLPASPPRCQEYASEAYTYSPTLEQVLFMTRHAPPRLGTLAAAVSTTREPPDPALRSQQHRPPHRQPPTHLPWLGSQ